MTWIACLIVFAFILLFLEIFVPGGVLGVLAVCCIIGAGYLTFIDYGVAAATLLTIGAAVLAVVMFFIEIKLLKASGRHLAVESSIESRSVELPDDPSLVGKEGVALTTLAPGGKVQVNGKQFEASSLSGLLRKGTEIEVVRVEDFRLIVKKS